MIFCMDLSSVYKFAAAAGANIRHVPEIIAENLASAMLTVQSAVILKNHFYSHS